MTTFDMRCDYGFDYILSLCIRLTHRYVFDYIHNTHIHT